MTGAIFVGQGRFSLKPATEIDAHELARRTHAETVEEDFTGIVFRFSPGTHTLFLKGSKGTTATPPAALSLFRNWQQKVRQRHEIPASLSAFAQPARHSRR